MQHFSAGEMMAPVRDVVLKKVPESVVPVVDPELNEDVKECFQRCTAAYGNSGADFLRCIYRCSHGDPNFEIPVEKIVRPVSGIREARVRDCAISCLLTGPFYAVCLAATCPESRMLKDDARPEVTLEKKAAVIAPFTPDFVDKKPIEFYVRECNERCELAYKKTDVDYSYCLIGCSIGGQRPEEKVGIVPSPVGVRDARGFDSCMSGYCKWVVGLPPALVPCMGVCLAAGGRRRSIDYPMDETRPKVTLDKKAAVIAPFTPEFVNKKPVEFYVRECYERCEFAYKKTDADYASCLLGCTIGGGKLQDKVAALGHVPFTHVRE
jgi:hypothetical protein